MVCYASLQLNSGVCSGFQPPGARSKASWVLGWPAAIQPRMDCGGRIDRASLPSGGRVARRVVAAVGGGDGRPVGETRGGQNIVHAVLDGGRRYEKLFGDFLVAETIGHQGGDFSLAFRQDPEESRLERVRRVDGAKEVRP